MARYSGHSNHSPGDLGGDRTPYHLSYLWNPYPFSATKNVELKTAAAAAVVGDRPQLMPPEDPAAEQRGVSCRENQEECSELLPWIVAKGEEEDLEIGRKGRGINGRNEEKEGEELRKTPTQREEEEEALFVVRVLFLVLLSFFLGVLCRSVRIYTLQ